MPTAILDKLLQTQFGKAFIFWVFLAMAAAIAFLAWYVVQQQHRHDAAQAASKAEIIACEKDCAKLIDEMRREQIAELRQASERQTQIENKLKIK